MIWIWIVEKAVPFALKYKKILIYIGAGLVIFLFIAWYGNAQWNKGVTFGDNRTQKRMEDAEKKRWIVIQKEINIEKDKYKKGVQENENYRNVLVAQAKELGHARQLLENAAIEIKATAKANISAGYLASQVLTEHNAADELRKLSRELDTDRNWRERIPARTNGVLPPK